MISRDAKAQLVALLVGFGVLLAIDLTDVVAGTGTDTTLVSLVFFAIVFGGAHLYLALRGDGGMVPVDARWRYLAALAVTVCVIGVVSFAGERTVLGVEVRIIGYAVLVTLVLAYLVSEAVDAYRAARPS